jgi:peptide chain release factor 1
VTVTVLEDVPTKSFVFSDTEFKIEWYSGTGCGGQNRNKVQSSCRITHLPSGLVKTAQTRSRENSLKLAKDAILEALVLAETAKSDMARSKLKAQQAGSGERGDKIRTYMFQHGKVTDHQTEKSAPIDKIMLGRFELLW